MHDVYWDTEVAERTNERTRLHKNEHHKSIENLIQTHADSSSFCACHFLPAELARAKENRVTSHISCLGLAVGDTLGAMLMFSFHG